MDPVETVNSCRVCRSENQDGDFENLFVIEEDENVRGERTWALTEAGKLYEEMVELQIAANTLEYYPRHLCHSCELQMRLFKKLKTKAKKSFEFLESKYALLLKRVDVGDEESASVDEHSKEAYVQQVMDQLKGAEELLDEQEQHELNCMKEEELYLEGIEDNGKEIAGVEGEDKQMAMGIYFIASDDSLPAQLIVEPGKPDDCSEQENLQVANLYEHELESLNQANYKQEAATVSIEDNDRRGAGSEEVQKESYHFAEESSDQNCENAQYLEEDYLDDATADNVKTNIKRKSKGAKRAYQCEACEADFLRRTDLLEHRKAVHSNKHPCPECPQLLRTSDALRVHLQLHRGLPPYRCNLCPKTFNQKVHYKYHMDKHNNVRNFRCEHCPKAFLSKTDLSMHMRSHTGERPYACEICGKAFLLQQHLKMHRYSHFDRSFECEKCKQKFISPSTLRTHMQTIHSTQPQFQCEFCVKRFRRKHHLTTHYKVHQKAQVSSNADDFIDDSFSIMPPHDENSVGEPTSNEATVDDFIEGQIGGILIIDDEEHAIYGDRNVITIDADVDDTREFVL